MKLQSKVKVEVRGHQFGGGHYQILGSIAPANAAELQELLTLAKESALDALEIILNCYQAPAQFADDLAALQNDLPISVRIQQQGTDEPMDLQIAF